MKDNSNYEIIENEAELEKLWGCKKTAMIKVTFHE